MAAKTFVCYKIEWAFKGVVTSVTENNIVVSSGSLNQIKTKKATFVENTQNSDAGDIVKQQLNISGGLTPEMIKEFANRSILFKLQLSKGKTRIFGSIDNPVLMQTSNQDAEDGKVQFNRIVPVVFA